MSECQKCRDWGKDERHEDHAKVRPLRIVTASRLTSGRGSVLGPDTWRRAYWWNLTLECGHTVTRGAKYRHNPKAKAGARLRSDVLPGPVRARCDRCTS